MKMGGGRLIELNVPTSHTTGGESVDSVRMLVQSVLLPDSVCPLTHCSSKNQADSRCGRPVAAELATAAGQRDPFRLIDI